VSESLHVRPGHFYSPIPSAQDIERAVLNGGKPDLVGIDVDLAGQLALVGDLSSHYSNVLNQVLLGGHRFQLQNTWFTYADAIFMALMIRNFRPRNIVEVGCGHSSALILDEIEAGRHTVDSVTFIDPDCTRLRSVVSEQDLFGMVLETPVQDAPIATFLSLGPGDMLAIDSSHVLKAGSDVHYLFTEVFPRLQPGVFIHIHDIFWPFEYPPEWLHRGVAFTEVYGLHLLLQQTQTFRIRLFTDYLITLHSDRLKPLMPLIFESPMLTGGIWIERR
jgi:hypothetical protein